MTNRIMPLVCCLIFLVGDSPAREFLKPTNTVGDANCFGELQFTSHLGVIKISENEKFDFHYTFSSSSEYESPHLGKGFFVPLLEATLIDHDYFLEATKMGGGTVYMYRLPADPTRFISLNGKNKATKLGDNRYTRENEDGFRFEYRLGKLFRAKSPAGVQLTFDYEGDICRSITSGTGATIVTFSKRSDTEAVFTNFKGRYRLSYQLHPGAQNQSTDLPPSYTLKSIGWPNGHLSTFDYSETREDPDSIILTMSYQNSSAKYQWNRTTGHIIYADGAKYEVRPLQREIDYEKERRSTGAYSIRRIFDDGTWTSFHHDEDAGYSELQSSDGPTIRTHYINTRGPVFNLVRKRERIDPISGTREAFYEAFYDTKGNLIREVNKGEVTWYLRKGGLDESAVNAEDNMVQFDDRNRVYYSRWNGSTHETEWKANGTRRMISRHPWGEIVVQYFDATGKPMAMPTAEKFPERHKF